MKTLKLTPVFLITLALSLQIPNALAAVKAAKLQIAVKGANLNFDKAKITVKAGQEVDLTFSNSAPKDSGLQHNWVLTKPGTDADISTAGIMAGPAKGYIPDSPNIIAHTKLLNAGDKETLHFKAPAEKGEYPYLCTFPGHYPLMKGILEVK